MGGWGGVFRFDGAVHGSIEGIAEPLVVRVRHLGFRDPASSHGQAAADSSTTARWRLTARPIEPQQARQIFAWASSAASTEASTPAAPRARPARRGSASSQDVGGMVSEHSPHFEMYLSSVFCIDCFLLSDQRNDKYV